MKRADGRHTAGSRGKVSEPPKTRMKGPKKPGFDANGDRVAGAWTKPGFFEKGTKLRAAYEKWAASQAKLNEKTLKGPWVTPRAFKDLAAVDDFLTPDSLLDKVNAATAGSDWVEKNPSINLDEMGHTKKKVKRAVAEMLLHGRSRLFKGKKVKVRITVTMELVK